jgi:hypothetical protein
VNKVIAVLIVLFMTMALVEPAHSRQVEIIRIETHDGNVFMGTLISEDDQKLIMRVDGVGEITIEISNIKRRTVIDPARIRDGVYWYPNPQATRYFFAPNAMGLKKGRGYYQNTWIFFNNVNYGVTDNFSIGGGLIPGFLFGAGLSGTPVWILPKLSFPVAGDNFHLAAGAMIGGAAGSGSGALLYGSATLGDSDRNLTAGLGYGYAGGDLSNTPLVNISGMYRTSRRVYLLTEIYFLPGIEGSGVALFGARWAPENFAVDFGLITPLESGVGYIGIPWLGITLPFGN